MTSALAFPRHERKESIDRSSPGMKSGLWGVRYIAGLFAAAIGAEACASAPDTLPPLVVAGRETFDVFAVPAGVEPGAAVLNKIQLSATVRGDQFGLRGWTWHIQIIRVDGQSLSRRLGDLQTADNIEAAPAIRLFETYAAHLWGDDKRSVSVRLGLIDLNSQFDSIDPASVMLNSSHGIAPDLSRGGRNGPSIYPVTAGGTTVTWTRSQKWTARSPRAFFVERLRPSDGLLLIGQGDWQIGKDQRLEGGAWGYTAAQPGVAGGRAHDHGAYLSYESPFELLPKFNFWLRAGVASGAAQAVAGYVGGGIVEQGVLRGRPDDRLGLGIAHAIVSDQAVRALGIHHAETSVELTYQARISRRFVIQPDVDFIHHPAGKAHAPDAIGLGLRFVIVGAYPLRMAANDPGDPTVPPDGSPGSSDDSE